LNTVTKLSIDKDNRLFQIATDLVNQSSRHIFLTGKAGTGKTTFLKYIRENCIKQMAVIAPTGVAAINAGGVTIHSFFQLPFSPFIPEGGKFSDHHEEVVNRHSLLKRLRLNTEKLKVIRQLELLVIDEVSMVRCDIMDAIDTVLRHVRKKPFERFGGVQMLFIGDMFQLPPVIKDQEWRLLREHYNSPYFFDSLVIREQLPLYIEFDKIYRQSEEVFIRVLNKVRNNALDEEGMEILEQRFQPSFRRSAKDGFIVLTTHNERAREINRRELDVLPGETVSYKAEIQQEFPDNAYPADEILQLKPGAQVMFIKNDADRTKRYFNGKIGIVSKLEEDRIYVQCLEEPDEIEVKPEKWENIRYVINNASRALEEDVLGSFSQFPLRLAWAITIHKSQGLTFNKAIIDAGEAFAPGQVYVALSRCTSLEGMVLQSRIRSNSLFTDNRIVEFSQNCLSLSQLQDELLIAKKKYQEASVLAIFDFHLIVEEAGELDKYLLEHSSSFNAETLAWSGNLLEKLSALQATAQKFHLWLEARYGQEPTPEAIQQLQLKTKDGAIHFTKELQQIIALVQQSPAETDSRIHAKEFNEAAKEIFAGLSQKSFLLNGFNGHLYDIDWHSKKREYVQPPFVVNAFAGSASSNVKSDHPALYMRLKRLRDDICAKKNLAIYMVAGSKTLDEMANYLPQSAVDLEKITGFGKIKVESYGEQFLEIIREYCSEYGLSSRMIEKLPKKKQKDSSKVRTDTKNESFRLFSEGMSVEGVSKARSLTVQTVQGHLAYFVSKGELAIESVVSPEKIVLIEPLLKDIGEGSIVQIRERLGNSIGFGEIRLVMAWSAFKNGITQEP
jgi:hypothetical protein